MASEALELSATDRTGWSGSSMLDVASSDFAWSKVTAMCCGFWCSALYLVWLSVAKALVAIPSYSRGIRPAHQSWCLIHHLPDRIHRVRIDHAIQERLLLLPCCERAACLMNFGKMLEACHLVDYQHCWLLRLHFLQGSVYLHILLPLAHNYLLLRIPHGCAALPQHLTRLNSNPSCSHSLHHTHPLSLCGCW